MLVEIKNLVNLLCLTENNTELYIPPVLIKVIDFCRFRRLTGLKTIIQDLICKYECLYFLNERFDIFKRKKIEDTRLIICLVHEEKLLLIQHYRQQRDISTSFL